MTKEIATKNETLPMADWMADDLGAGMEGADKDSFAIPFLVVLQTNSPQVDEAEGEYIEGAKPGMLMNSVTGQLYDGKQGLIFLPCAFQRRFIRWVSRDLGGGFKGEYMPEDAMEMLDKGEVVQIENNIYFPDQKTGEIDEDKADKLKDTRNHFGIIYDPETGTAEQVLLSLSSTQIKKSKRLMAMLSNRKVKGPKGLVTPPTWVNQIRVTSVPEKNDKGKWHGVKFEADGMIQDQEVYQMGKDFHELIAAGEAKAAYETVAEEGSNGSERF